MRRVFGLFGVAILAVVMAFTTATPAVAGHDDDRFQVVLRPIQFHYEDVGRRGPSAGDYFVFSEKLFNQGERVGRDSGRCDVTRVGRDKFTFHCFVTLTLRGQGKITLQGELRFRRSGPAPGRLAITGGTRRYAGAAGSARLVEQRGEPTRLRLRLR